MTKQTKPSPTVRASRGLMNPEVTARKSSGMISKRRTPQQLASTHIPEPRVQRLISLAVVICLVALEVYFWLHRHK